MRVLPVLACAALFLLAPGCARVEDAGSAPPASADAGGGDGAVNGSSEAPEVLADGGNAHVRLALRDHAVEGERVTLLLEVENKDAAGVKRLAYAHLGVEGSERTLYFDVYRNVPAGQTGRYQLAATDEGLARSPWASLALYYQEDAGGEHASDEAVALDLRGRGLPRNVS